MQTVTDWKRYWDEGLPYRGGIFPYLTANRVSETWITRVGPQLRWHPSAGIVSRIWRGLSWIGVHTVEPPDGVTNHYGEIRGGAIRLLKDCADREGLLVGESIHDTLALAQLMNWDGRVWATDYWRNLGEVQVPHDVKRIVIACDFDGAGIMGAELLRDRMSDKTVDIRLPSALGMRWGEMG